MWALGQQAECMQMVIYCDTAVSASSQALAAKACHLPYMVQRNEVTSYALLSHA